MDNEGVDASFDLVPRANHRGDAAGPARLKNLLVSSAWDAFSILHILSKWVPHNPPSLVNSTLLNLHY